MKMKEKKKCFVIATAVMFLILSVFSSVNAESEMTFTPQTTTSEKPSQEFTFYKIDTNGQLSPLAINITLEDGQDPELIIAEKCKELCENDKELQEFIETNDDSKWIEIESQGKGFHRSFRRIWQINKTVKWRTIIKYSHYYKEDYTNIRFNETQKWINVLEGPQTFRLIGFTGYAYFKPRLFWGKTIIHGYTLGYDYAPIKWLRWIT